MLWSLVTPCLVIPTPSEAEREESGLADAGADTPFPPDAARRVMLISLLSGLEWVTQYIQFLYQKMTPP
jgi:hypothetical protein